MSPSKNVAKEKESLARIVPAIKGRMLAVMKGSLKALMKFRIERRLFFLFELLIST